MWVCMRTSRRLILDGLSVVCLTSEAHVFQRLVLALSVSGGEILRSEQKGKGWVDQLLWMQSEELEKVVDIFIHGRDGVQKGVWSDAMRFFLDKQIVRTEGGVGPSGKRIFWWEDTSTSGVEAIRRVVTILEFLHALRTSRKQHQTSECLLTAESSRSELKSACQ